MVTSGNPDDRCGYAYDVSTLPDVSATSCWRPTWGDEDRCVWHADVEDKSREALEEMKPNYPERLDGAAIGKVSLDDVDWFERCSLVGVELVDVDLRNALLRETDLREATFTHVDVRRSDFTDANLEDASLTECDLRDTTLEDARFDQAVFSNVRINRGTAFGKRSVYEDELEDADDEETFGRYAQAAIWAYREIQNIHEENALPFEARHYYLKETDIRRQIAWHNEHYARALKSESARWITGYGMSPWRVIGTAAVIILVSALLYPTTGGLEETVVPGNVDGSEVNGSTSGSERTITWSIDDPETASLYYLGLVFFRSLYFSVVTFTTLGYGDISPVGDFARAIAGVEALLGQLLVALLVFVLTRRIS